MHDRNKHLGNIAVSTYSNQQAWWSCPDCPDSCPHIWRAVINDRSRGTGCPFCSGAKVCEHNSLAIKATDVACYWHPEKNLPLSPNLVTAQSTYRAHWLCSACKHEWQTSVGTKVITKSGCPQCARASGNRCKDGIRLKHPTFAEAEQPLLSQWTHSLNQKEGNFPDSTRLRSNQRIWWMCDQCPKGCKHSWQATPSSRTSLSRNCPYCAGRKACQCNSLQTLYPDIAADFDTVANGLSPAEITASTHRGFQWLSDKAGAKLRSPHDCTTYAQAQNKLARQTARCQGP